MDNGGAKLLGFYYNGNLSKALCAVYPEHQLRIFTNRIQFPNHFWQQEGRVRDLLDDVAKRLGIKEWKDWYKVTPKELNVRFLTTFY